MPTPEQWRRLGSARWQPLQPCGLGDGPCYVEMVLATNALGQVRDEWLNGRQYLVAPLTSIVEGVLPGSKGSLFYPNQEIKASVPDWDGVPLTNYHPYDPLTSEHLSAGHPGVLDRQGIGTVKDSRWNGKLQHEAWFDVLDTQRVNPEILANLRAGIPIEVSTGLFTRNEPAPQGASFKGRPYTHIARDYKPDHMAVLPTGQGACSIRDGCGVLINSTKPSCPPGGT